MNFLLFGNGYATMGVYYFVIPRIMAGPEAFKSDAVEDKKIPDKMDTKGFSDKNGLDMDDQKTIDGLGLPKDKEITAESLNSAMNANFDKEIAKAGESGQAPEIAEAKKQLSEQIGKAPSMQEKIALYQEFMAGLNAKVGTQEAAQMKNQTDYADSLKKTKTEKLSMVTTPGEGNVGAILANGKTVGETTANGTITIGTSKFRLAPGQTVDQFLGKSPE